MGFIPLSKDMQGKLVGNYKLSVGLISCICVICDTLQPPTTLNIMENGQMDMNDYDVNRDDNNTDNVKSCVFLLFSPI